MGLVYVTAIMIHSKRPGMQGEQECDGYKERTKMSSFEYSSLQDCK